MRLLVKVLQLFRGGQGPAPEVAQLQLACPSTDTTGRRYVTATGHNNTLDQGVLAAT